MIWSLGKIILFIVVVAALTLGAGYLIESDGGVRIQSGGNEYTLGPLQSVIGLFILIVAIWIILKSLSFLVALWKFFS